MQLLTVKCLIKDHLGQFLLDHLLNSQSDMK